MRFLFPLLILILCLAGCQEPEDPIPESPAYESGYLLFRSARGDTLYYEEYTDWCAISPTVRLEQGGLSLAGGPAYTYTGYKSNGSKSPLFSIYQGIDPGEQPGPGLVKAYRNNDYAIFRNPNTHYVVACTVDGVRYSSHLFNYRRASDSYLQHADPDAVLQANSEYYYPSEEECSSSSHLLIRTDLHYTGQLYGVVEPFDSILVTVDMLVNLGV